MKKGITFSKNPMQLPMQLAEKNGITLSKNGITFCEFWQKGYNIWAKMV